MEKIDEFVEYLKSKVDPLHKSLLKVIKKQKCDEKQIQRLNIIIDEKVFAFVDEQITYFKLNNGLNKEDYQYLKNRIISSDLFNNPILHSFEIDKDYETVINKEFEELESEVIDTSVNNEAVMEKQEITEVTENIELLQEDLEESNKNIELDEKIDENLINNEEKVEQVEEITTILDIKTDNIIEEVINIVEQVDKKPINNIEKIEEITDNINEILIKIEDLSNKTKNLNQDTEEKLKKLENII